MVKPIKRPVKPNFMLLQMGMGRGVMVHQPSTLAVPLFATMVFISLMVWYFYKKLEQKLESQKTETKKEAGPSPLKLLGGTEKMVAKLLMQMDGVGLQSDLSRKMDKLRVHRAVKSLEQKGIIDVVPKGRTKLIRIKKEFKGLLSPENQ